MRNLVWPIGLGIGGVLFVAMVIGWNLMQQDLDNKAQDLMLRQHNAYLEQMKEAGVVDPDTPAVTRESMEQGRQEALERLRDHGGPSGLAREMNNQAADAAGVPRASLPATGMPPTPPAAQPPSASSGADTQMTLLVVSLVLILLLTFGGLGGALYGFHRADQRVVEQRGEASGGPVASVPGEPPSDPAT